MDNTFKYFLSKGPISTYKFVQLYLTSLQLAFIHSVLCRLCWDMLTFPQNAYFSCHHWVRSCSALWELT